MKALLMYKDRDFDLQRKLPPNEKSLAQDLELNTLFEAMALGDKFIFEVARRAIFESLSDPDTIIYRQEILRDCLENPEVVTEIYQIPIEAMEEKRHFWWGHSSFRQPGIILSEARRLLEMFVGLLKRLKVLAQEHSHKFQSEGFRRFFAMIESELDDEYFAIVERHLKELEFGNGVLISAELGEGNEGTNYVLRKPRNDKVGWMDLLFARRPPAYTFHIAARDEAGVGAVEDLRKRGINLVANALAQSADHIDGFFNMLLTELAFYIGCLNLSDELAMLGEPISFPRPVAAEERRRSFLGLYDVCLALTMKQRIVGNDLSADDKDLVIVTGANQGGKSTFLRSIGSAQLMMQCGMFVPAEAFRANVCHGLFTHYKREEDATMKSGKLDEELARMSDIVENLTSDSLVLFNESFAATNEREGAEIARQIVTVQRVSGNRDGGVVPAL